MIDCVLRHIAAFRARPSARLLDVLYGPRAQALRTRIASLMLGRKVTSRDKAAQYGALRVALLAAVGATGNCTAAQDADFEERCTALLQEVS